MLLRAWFFSLMIFLFGRLDVTAQEKYNHFPDTLVKGIYWSYHDLVENAPFYTDTFHVLYANNARMGSHRFPEWEYFYSVNEDRVAYKPKDEYRFKDGSYFFGYSDGENVYISFKRFHPLTIFGPISLINVVEDGTRSDYFTAGFAGGLIGLAVAAAINEGGGYGKVDDWFVIDLYSGSIEPIHPIYLNPIFRKYDKELYKEFKQTKKRNKLETMIDFVLRFNERNPMPE